MLAGTTTLPKERYNYSLASQRTIPVTYRKTHFSQYQACACTSLDGVHVNPKMKPNQIA